MKQEFLGRESRSEGFVYSIENLFSSKKEIYREDSLVKEGIERLIGVLELACKREGLFEIQVTVIDYNYISLLFDRAINNQSKLRADSGQATSHIDVYDQEVSGQIMAYIRSIAISQRLLSVEKILLERGNE